MTLGPWGERNHSCRFQNCKSAHRSSYPMSFYVQVQTSLLGPAPGVRLISATMQPVLLNVRRTKMLPTVEWTLMQVNLWITTTWSLSVPQHQLLEECWWPLFWCCSVWWCWGGGQRRPPVTMIRSESRRIMRSMASTSPQRVAGSTKVSWKCGTPTITMALMIRGCVLISIWSCVLIFIWILYEYINYRYVEVCICARVLSGYKAECKDW